jgi:hypothetical protein
MAHNSTYNFPMVLRKERRLPTPGQVLVKTGDSVKPDTIVAKGVVDNPLLKEIKVFTQLRVDPEDVKKFMLKKEGDQVQKDEVIAMYRSFLGRTRVARSPIDGSIVALSTVSGRAMVKGHPIPVEVQAHIPGTVVEIFPKEGATIETKVEIIHGKFGIGGESRGDLIIAVESPDSALTSDIIIPDHKGKIIVGGSIITLDALRKAVKTGVAGVVIGGIDQKDITEFLGYEIGVGITGDEPVGLTLIVTEGFGVNPMSDEDFEFLNNHSGELACIDGTTQIRSRIRRPEIIIPV